MALYPANKIWDLGWHPGAGLTLCRVLQHGLSGLHNRLHHLDCQLKIWGCMQTEQLFRARTGYGSAAGSFMNDTR